jgi:hypothetical protein
MVEPTARIRDGDGRQRLRDGVIERRAGPRFGFPQVRFALRPAALDRRQIRRVRRQAQQLGACRCHRLPDARCFVGTQLVHAPNVAGVQRWPPHRLDIDTQHLSIGGAVNGHHRLDPLAAERYQPGDVRAIIWRDGPDVYRV